LLRRLLGRDKKMFRLGLF